MQKEYAKHNNYYDLLTDVVIQAEAHSSKSIVSGCLYFFLD